MGEHRRWRIHNLEELAEFWPALLLLVRERISVTAVAYLHDARPIMLTDHEIVLEFSRPFHYEKAVSATQRFPYEAVINECLATAHQLRIQLAPQKL